MFNVWLVQRGHIKEKPNDSITGIDSLIDFSYMGSAEFEFGGLPKSLHRIADNDKYVFVKVSDIKDKNGLPMFVYCDSDKSDDAVAAAKYISKNSYGYKEVPYLKEYLDGKKLFYEENFWWDIDNDYFIFLWKGTS
jgi:hypothetical protein